MIAKREFRLRTFVVLLLVTTIFVTITVVGSGILFVRLPQIIDGNRRLVEEASRDMAERVETFLEGEEYHLALVGTLLPLEDLDAMDDALGVALGNTFEAIYLLDPAGVLVANRVSGASIPRNRELIGIDFSSNSLFREVMKKRVPVWSDKHLSAVTGSATIALAVPTKAGVVIGEIALSTLLRISQTARSDDEFELWIIDGNGEMVADTGSNPPSRMNLLHLPIVAAGLGNHPLPGHLVFDGHTFQASASFSESLGWLFVSRISTGLENPAISQMIGTIFAAFLASCAIGLLLAPFWAHGMTRSVRAVMERTRRYADGEQFGDWPRGRVSEINQLSSDLETMAMAIQQRQRDLRTLNEELEIRVEHRTRDLAKTNTELHETLEALYRTQSELVQSEKLAALGRLVAGIAHELNTPLGNGRMAVSTLGDRITEFSRRIESGLRRSDLDNFMQDLKNATDVAERNIIRAGELVASFKQVAVDRTASHRRKFQLDEVVTEIVLTLTPSIKRLPITILKDVAADVRCDSYPGELGQILTNLIDNAIRHAFGDGRKGTIRITATTKGNEVVLLVADDGMGIPRDIVGRIFDPFFTTKMGHGGTGLGLYITHNAVGNLLGGTIAVESEPNAGTRFELRFPKVAPEPKEE